MRVRIFLIFLVSLFIAEIALDSFSMEICDMDLVELAQESPSEKEAKDEVEEESKLKTFKWLPYDVTYSASYLNLDGRLVVMGLPNPIMEILSPPPELIA